MGHQSVYSALVHSSCSFLTLELLPVAYKYNTDPEFFSLFVTTSPSGLISGLMSISNLHSAPTTEKLTIKAKLSHEFSLLMPSRLSLPKPGIFFLLVILPVEILHVLQAHFLQFSLWGDSWSLQILIVLVFTMQKLTACLMLFSNCFRYASCHLSDRV